MNHFFKKKEWVIAIIFFTIFIISSISGISYLKSDSIYDAKISYINNEKLPYSLIVSIEKEIDSNLDFEFEIIYPKENLVIGSEKASCNQKTCEIKVPIKKAFFDKLSLTMVAEDENKKFYKKIIDFQLKKKDKINSLIVNPNLVVSAYEKPKISGNLVLEYSTPVIFKIFPEKSPENSQTTRINCTSNCFFEINLSENIEFGKYSIQAYLPEDTLSSHFTIQLEQNKTDIKEKKEVEYNFFDKKDEITIIDFQGRKKVISSEDKNINIKKIASLDREETISQELSPSLSSLSNKKYLKKISTKNEVIVTDFNPQLKTKSVGFSDLVPLPLEFQKALPIEKEIVYQDEKIYYDNAKKFIDLHDGESLAEMKIVPGIYTYEKTTRFDDGSQIIEEESFAYGLISINSKKPLYKTGEVIDFLIVVLDKWGYLVDNAQINLQITKPSGDTLILDTISGQILKTDDSGVYQASILSDELGKYEIYAEVEINGIIVDVISFVNTVEEYPFDIIRDVPVTIDPWLGPFENSFELSLVDSKYQGLLNLTEIVSSDFDIEDTNANSIKTIGEVTYLKWNNIDIDFTPYYIAQVPLVTPYLYYLGNAWIDYSGERFNENRSWLFAIDPAAQICGFTSPCICGAGCSGGNEPGDGTIDACSDGDTTYEYINDIRVTALNSSYFGVGDTVEVCFDYQCDTSSQGDRVSFGYKNGGSAWVNGDVYNEFRCDNNNLNTLCSNIVLDNFVGAHHVRGKLVWEFSARPANDICDEPTYYDHDDIEFEVLDKVAPSQISWNLNNGTSIGNNLTVLRGSLINSTLLWNLSLISGTISHDSTGAPVVYDVDSFNNNQTQYNFDTSDVSLFPNIGRIEIDQKQANEKFFNITGNSSGTRTFDIIAEIGFDQSNLFPNVGFEGVNTTMTCNFFDANVISETYSGILINFLRNNISIGSNMTNSSGSAMFSFQENTIGEYNITCRAQSNLSNFFITSDFAEDTKKLFVRENNSDITVPVISNVSTNPILFSVGGITTITAHVTDDVNLDSVDVFIIRPNNSISSFPMINVGGDTFNYTFSQTIDDGIYRYYVQAVDNSSNPAFSSTRNFEVIGIRSFIGIQSQQNFFKLGEPLNLTLFSKIEDIQSTIFSEGGDISNIFYSFDSSDEGWVSSGSQDEWERGVPSFSQLVGCDSGNCFATDLNNNYNNNANNNIISPILNLSGRFNPSITFWNEIDFTGGINDRIFFEVFDGVSWNILNQNTIGADTQAGAFLTFFSNEIADVSNSQLRFRMTSNGNTVDAGYSFDSVNVSFDPRVEETKNWYIINSTFGSNVSKLAAIKVGLNITNYDASGSSSLGNLLPEIELQIFNGTDYSTSRFCSLDDTKTYPYFCEFVIKNTPEFLDAWQNSDQRNIKFRVINVDQGDNVTFTDVKREYITPSIVENNGEGQLTAFLLQQFKNSTGGIVSTLNFAPISINPGESAQLSDFWTYSIAGDFQLGNYSAYVALTDGVGNVLQNEDDLSFINDSYYFTIRSLIINYLNPSETLNSTETFKTNITLDTSLYGFGGWCGYSLDGQANVTLSNPSLNYLESTIENISDDTHTINIFCNDTDGDFVTTGIRSFNISEPPRISFVSPTPVNNTIVNQSWSVINVSIMDATLNTSWLEFDSVSYPMSCNFQTGSTYYCDYNISIKNGVYGYRVCANDSLNNMNCTEERLIQINAPLPMLTILSPLNNSKTLLGSLVNITVSSDLPLDNAVYSINGGGNTSLHNISSILWNGSQLLSTGRYTITVFANDSVDNIVSLSHVFYILPDKHIRVTKSISSITGNNRYLVSYNITNLGEWTNHSLLELIPTGFLKTSGSRVPTDSQINTSGTLERYNLNISYDTSILFNSTYTQTLSTDILNLFTITQE